ncbi:hypothetical protein EVAR_22239_1 [Eumeta japonica]|uniref:Uncharacterized protein n=1 Tax=Eumeta variegata TaxID=151549 RepID=A0A4C1UAI0_EUMVA|nr:hypothetical protein EVAR_22239_1 [Eumeta japonica]
MYIKSKKPKKPETIVEDDVDSPTPATRKEQKPPLFSFGKRKISEIRRQCELKNIVISHTRNKKNKELKVQPDTISDFRNLTNLLATIKAAYHTYSLKEEREFRVVLKSVPKAFSLDEVKNDPLAQKLPVRAIRREAIFSKSRRRAPFQGLKWNYPTNEAHQGSVTTVNSQNKETDGPPACVLCNTSGHTANCLGCPRATKKYPLPNRNNTDKSNSPNNKAAPCRAVPKNITCANVTAGRRKDPLKSNSDVSTDTLSQIMSVISIIDINALVDLAKTFKAASNPVEELLTLAKHASLVETIRMKPIWLTIFWLSVRSLLIPDSSEQDGLIRINSEESSELGESPSKIDSVDVYMDDFIKKMVKYFARQLPNIEKDNTTEIEKLITQTVRNGFDALRYFVGNNPEDYYFNALQHSLQRSALEEKHHKQSEFLESPLKGDKILVYMEDLKNDLTSYIIHNSENRLLENVDDIDPEVMELLVSDILEGIFREVTQVVTNYIDNKFYRKVDPERLADDHIMQNDVDQLEFAGSLEVDAEDISKANRDDGVDVKYESFNSFLRLTIKTEIPEISDKKLDKVIAKINGRLHKTKELIKGILSDARRSVSEMI